MPDKTILLVEAELGGELPPSQWQQGRLVAMGLFRSKYLGSLTRYDVPGNYAKGLHCWNDMCRDNWGFELGGIHQCKALGGCGVMNGALMQLTHPANFDSWPEGWRAQDLQSFVRMAQRDFHITQTPSADGRHYLSDAGGNFVRRAFEKYGGAAGGFVEDNTTQPRGGIFHVPHVSAKDGVRQSTAQMCLLRFQYGLGLVLPEVFHVNFTCRGICRSICRGIKSICRYLPEALKRPNFKLLKMKRATKIETVAGTQATGVRVKDEETGDEDTLQLKDGGLVVVTAGAINTPRLLLRSGITGYGTVGKTIKDHSLWHQMFRCWRDNDPKTYGEVTDQIMSQYLHDRSGALAQFGPILMGFWKDPRTSGGNDQYDVEFFLGPQAEVGRLALHVALMRDTCSNAEMVLNPDGTIKLEGSPRNACAHDIITMEHALGWLDHMLGSAGCHKEGETERSWAFNHWAGSCALGACVDPQSLRVRGTMNVAVADASITPTTIWAHPALTLKGIAFKAADVLAKSMP
ncbi:betA [Symbiodinium natans]|uniref:BetA protein n=1 Tax=Symbiodinium natans TaxID=878477 RepID=A0A812JX34_9DINO|nr:betA [Symbiodinium natans]